MSKIICLNTKCEFQYWVICNVVVLQHVSGLCNSKADALSRFQVDAFRRLHPMADVEPTVVPASVWAGFDGCDGST